MMARLQTALIGVGAWGKVLANAASGSDRDRIRLLRRPQSGAAFGVFARQPPAGA